MIVNHSVVRGGTYHGAVSKTTETTETEREIKREKRKHVGAHQSSSIEDFLLVFSFCFTCTSTPTGCSARSTLEGVLIIINSYMGWEAEF